MLADLDAATTVHIGEYRAEQAVQATSAAAKLMTLASCVEVLLKRLLVMMLVAIGLRAISSALDALLGGAVCRFGRVYAVGT